MRLAGVLMAAAAVALGGAAPASGRFGADFRETYLLSRATDGGFPNGASSNAAISGDYQLARVIAFQSDATNLVSGDSNGSTDVFIVSRRRPYSIDGEPWRPGRTRLVSRGRGGRPANGPSYLPDVGGDRHHPPGCIAFVSEASNLVRGDTNGVADAFVYDLHSGRIRRVSVGPHGRQANGATTEVQVDGGCARFAFVSQAGNLGRRRHPRLRRTQVFLRTGRQTVLVSASRSGAHGNGASSEVSLSRAGVAVAYTSAATNLARGDHNHASDVYLTRVRGRRRVTTLVSRTHGGRAGNGASDQPDVAASGRIVAFRTAASNLLAHDRNRVSDVAVADLTRPGRFSFASRSQALGRNGDGPSGQPSSVEPGTNVFFSSTADNLQSTVRSGALFDRNGAGDVFFWSALSKNVSLQSRDSKNEILNNKPLHHHQADPEHLPQAAAENPAVSYYGNYMLFESPYVLIDLDLAHEEFPGLTAYDAAVMSHGNPALRQVYMRYIGPR